ncbi:alpha/beta hydrolase [Nanoarchaeota archaeon]
MNCIIVHGSPTSDRTKDPDYIPGDKGHWLPWLKEELEKRGIKTYVPFMPTSWDPKYNEWKEVFDKFPIDENSILIGHSAGGAFLVRWLGETNKKIKKLILVSPGKVIKRDSLRDLYSFKTNTKIKENMGKIIIMTADDDIEYHIPNAYEYQKEIGGEVIKFGKGYGHFTEKRMGTKQFPELLNKVIN